MEINCDQIWPFEKMHGLGNDFVIVDQRAGGKPVTPELIRALADRHRGVGFDQLATVSGEDRLRIAFYNADGSRSAACGNATRCIADQEMARRGSSELEIDIEGRGTLKALRRPDGLTAINMGAPFLRWDEIPLSEEMDTLHLPIEGTPTATGMGNPHCSFFVDDVSAIDLAKRGAALEHSPLFPERTNVQFAQIIGDNKIRMRVWERGTGITLASGSSSCAVAVAAIRRGLTGRAVEMVLDGGTLWIEWKDDGVWMAGPTAHVFSGALTQSFLDAL